MFNEIVVNCGLFSVGKSLFGCEAVKFSAGKKYLVASKIVTKQCIKVLDSVNLVVQKMSTLNFEQSFFTI